LDIDSLDNRKSISYPTDSTAIFVTQPWGGKREAVYTGFVLAMQDKEVEAIMTTDSDTVMDSKALKELSIVLDDPKTGCAVGECRIRNVYDSWLTFITDLRYWFSFNIERSCQSLYGTVVCVSGPIGIYRTAILKEVMDAWKDQKFLGSACTYGDDRHLTNLTLLLGWKVRYAPKSFCFTETPTTLFRFFKQQTRWSKSFFREILWSVRAFNLHPLWYGYEMTFHTFYPFLLIYWQIHILYFGTLLNQLLASSVIAVIGAYKAFAAFMLSGFQNRIIFYPFYTFIYTSILTPAKLLALITLWDSSWGTRGKSSDSIFYAMLTLWNSIMAGGFVYSFVRHYKSGVSSFEKLFAEILLGIVGGLVALGYVGYQVKKRNYISSKLIVKQVEVPNNTVIDVV